ncbi:putative Receptor-like cytosolic serine/threonine-protein kinase RBK2 [Cocos nucifera]|uniref:Putative Receptor-like cytosolic serine/threonine-protein kinase RBK2 n=1 Tax=Cocos nucifera TaxID=13894 RepID=A0A8K0IQV4_COCNU|nr:putative Receptor-like cytosolic serine/threonine-protein kinase RBK2 [Cocos nucifera]
MRRLSSFPPLGVPRLSRRKSNRETHVPLSDSTTDHSNCYIKPTWKNFTISELQKATNNFSPENIIGKGGYAEVYKGSLEDGQLVAIKKLTQGTADERTNNFLSELGIIVHVDHPNTAKLIGVGAEGGMHLVLQLSSHGSLENLLHENIIGKGGYAEVYKGSLEDGQLVAIKKLTQGTADERTNNFLSELGIIVHVDHPNTAKLIGVGAEGGMHLVLQLSSHGSLENLLHGSKEKLSWDVRYKIAIGAATGLEYLHERCQRRIIHRDIKAANVLLTDDFEPQAKPLLEKDDIKELVDPSLNDSYDIKQVLDLLKGKEMHSESMKVLHKSLIRRTYSVELFDAEEYNATRYLNDLTQHKKPALDF